MRPKRGLRHNRRANRKWCGMRVISPGFDKKMIFKSSRRNYLFLLDQFNNINYHCYSFLIYLLHMP
jgi:hypothetical protein